MAAIVNPLDWTGFDTTGNHDNAGIFRQLGAAVPVTGGVIEFPPGQIATSAACLLPSFTTVVGQGDATNLICLPNFPDWSATTPRAVFINRNWDSGGGETGISVRNLRMSGPLGESWEDGHFINFVRASRIRVDRVTSYGWGNCTAMIQCSDTEVSNCVAEMVSHCAYDHWASDGWARVINNYAMVTAGSKGSFGIMMTGIQTTGARGQSAKIVILGNQLQILGGNSRSALGSGIEINAGDDTGASSVNDVIITDNIISVTNNATHRGIHLAQAVSHAHVRGNILSGGVFGPAVTATGVWTTAIAKDCIIDGNTISDWLVDASQVAPLAWWGLNSSIINNRGRNVSSPFLSANMDSSNYINGNFAS